MTEMSSFLFQRLRARRRTGQELCLQETVYVRTSTLQACDKAISELAARDHDQALSEEEEVHNH